MSFKGLASIACLGTALAACSDMKGSSIGSDDLCRECRIEMEPLVRLQGSGEDIEFLMETKLVRSSSGYYYAAPLTDRFRVAVFDANGRFFRTFGQRGRGPGEIGEVKGLFAAGGDSIFVQDAMGKIEVFGPDGVPARTINSTLFPNVIAEIPSGDLIVIEGVSPGDLWLTDRNGVGQTAIATFPKSGGEFSSRAVALEPSGAIWSVDTNYRLEAFSQSGEAAGIWHVFIDDLELEGIRGHRRYAVRPLAIAAPGGNRLVILVYQRDLEWRSAPASASGEGSPIRLGVDDAVELSRFYLDVVDPRGMRLLVRQRLEGRMVGGLVDRDLLYTIEEETDYNVSIQVWRIRLVEG